jgi:hypothetical protein
MKILENSKMFLNKHFPGIDEHFKRYFCYQSRFVKYQTLTTQLIFFHSDMNNDFTEVYIKDAK